MLNSGKNGLSHTTTHTNYNIKWYIVYKNTAISYLMYLLTEHSDSQHDFSIYKVGLPHFVELYYNTNIQGLNTVENGFNHTIHTKL